MLRDVFYYGNKPNVHPRERHAVSLEHARTLATTEHFWIINEFCDYKDFDWDFDFDFLPDEDVWAQDHNNVWPSQHQKDSGTWLCPACPSDIIIYRSDVEPLSRKKVITENWKILDRVDETKFDFSWHPDPTDPPYIYKWGSKYYPVQFVSVLEYHVEGATKIKYMQNIVELEPIWQNWIEVQKVDRDKFDMSWRPDPRDPPYIYIWGNKFVDGKMRSTLEYHVPGATEKKYMPELLPVLPEWDRWHIIEDIDRSTFDFTWRPDPREPDLIYVFGNHLYDGKIMPTVEYRMENATERKYIDDWSRPRLAARPELFELLEDCDGIDYTWRPDPTSPPYIYVWGNQWNKPEDKISVQYVVEGATEYKYMDSRVHRKPCMENWVTPDNIDFKTFDYSWEPSPADPPFIYEFGTQWQKTGGPCYVVKGATERKYIDVIKSIASPTKLFWQIPHDIDEFDFSWHPDNTSPPYIYQFGTQWQKTGGPRYVIPGATEVKYIDVLKAKKMPNMENWEIPPDIDTSKFDFSWHPDGTEKPYIYQFGTQWQKTGGPRYVVKGATEVKYVDAVKSIAISNESKFKILGDYKVKHFDYSWHPDSTENPYIYVFGNNQYPADIMPTIEYHVAGATTRKYIDCLVAVLDNDFSRYTCLIDIDREKFDFSWRPNPKDPPYIYVFGNQWNPPEIEPTLIYTVEGATEFKYVNNLKAHVAEDFSNWQILIDIITESFDFSWRPNPKDPPYIYVFGNQYYDAEVMPTLQYVVSGATQIKYINDFKPSLKPNTKYWSIPDNVKVNNFDLGWIPNPKDPPYIYQFGTQWQKTGGPRYVIPGATEVKYVEFNKCEIKPNRHAWEIPEFIDIDEFDFSWHPDSTEKPYIYQFGTQWQKTGGPRYVIPGATEVKYVEYPVATALVNMKNWKIKTDLDISTFDFTWHPDLDSPAYIYQFGTIEDPNDGPLYITPHNNGEIVNLLRVEIKEVSKKKYPKYNIKTNLEDLIKEHPNEIFWAVRTNIDYTDFNFDWKPDIQQARYIHVFGSSESEYTQTYFVNSKMYFEGFKDFNFVEDKKLDEETLSKLFKKPDMFYIDKGNQESNKRFEMLKNRFPDIQKTRFLNSWVDTINRCSKKSVTELFWILDSELDYSEFDFSYYPNPWQLKMVHVFGTQWSHWGTTLMVNKHSFPEDTKYIKIVEHLNNLNFVKTKKAKAVDCLYDIVVIDHANKQSRETIDLLKNKTEKSVTVLKYEKSYLNTLRNFLRELPTKKDHYLWVCSSVCDYKNFDFSYICDPFAKDQLHVFPSNKQKFGDTFLVDVNKFKSLMEDMIVLEDFEKINFNQHQRVDRLKHPVIYHDHDTHDHIVLKDFEFPYATFVTNDNKDLDVSFEEPLCLWSEESKNIIVSSTGATQIIVPNEVKDHYYRELYDYPYITKSKNVIKSRPIDIVFLSNGEKIADDNYEHLLKVTKGLPNRIIRVDGVNGRVAAYHAAANASNTPWMFTVFAKLKVNHEFDWSWQPDRLQIPKHYIFYATNPLNMLEYGHQAMIAYNKNIVLSNMGHGLDFTLDNEHEVVELNSGIATFNIDEFTTWRTAFREAIKLKSDYADISQERLEVWLTKADGDFAQYCLDGARHAVEYYDEVEGDIEKLRLSYDWPWLHERFVRIYNK